MIKKIFKKYFSDNFHKNESVKSISVLILGALVSQVIPIAVLPVLARVFSPESFGVFGTLTSIAGIFTVVGSLKYEMAIVLPPSAGKKQALANLSFFILMIITLLSLLSVIVAKDFFAALLSDSKFNSGYFFFIPFLLFSGGILNISYQWLSSEKRFSDISLIKIILAVVANGFNIVTGIFCHHPAVLLIGQISGSFAGAGFFIVQCRDQIKSSAKKISFAKMQVVAREFNRFPIFTAPQHFLNTVSQNLPAIMLASFFGIQVTGFYIMSRRVLQIPVQLISDSIRPVLYKKMSDTFNRNESIKQLILKPTIGLFAIAVVPAIVFILWAEDLFVFFLGPNWVTTGKISMILVPWLLLAFINPPAVTALTVFRRQRMLLLFDTFLTIARVVAILSGWFFFNDAVKTILIFSVVGVVFNLYIVLYAIFVAKMETGNGKT